MPAMVELLPLRDLGGVVGHIIYIISLVTPRIPSIFSYKNHIQYNLLAICCE